MKRFWMLAVVFLFCTRAVRADTLKDIETVKKQMVAAYLLACTDAAGTGAAEQALKKANHDHLDAKAKELVALLKKRADEVSRLVGTTLSAAEAENQKRSYQEEWKSVEKDACAAAGALQTRPAATSAAAPAKPKSPAAPPTSKIAFNRRGVIFAKTEVGVESDPQELVVRNLSDRPVHLVEFAAVGGTGSPAGEFSIDESQCPLVLQEKGECKVTVRFTPPESGDRRGALYITHAPDSGGAPAASLVTSDLALRGVGHRAGNLALSQRVLDFKGLKVSTESAEKTITLENTGDHRLNLNEFLLEPEQDFVLDDSDCQSELESEDSCDIKVKFVPSAQGRRSAKLTIRYSPDGSGASPASREVRFRGNGTIEQGLDIRVQMLQFEPVEVGTSSAAQEIIVKNPSQQDIHLGGISLVPASSASSEFFIDTSGCPPKLPKIEQCTVKVTFSPPLAGDQSATLVIKSAGDAGGTSGTALSDQQVALRGSGFVKNIATLSGSGEAADPPSTRVVIGVDASGASSSDTQQKFFVAADLNTPIRVGTQHKDPLESRFWVFFSPRISSQPRETALSSLDASGSFFSTFLQEQPKALVQSVDLFGGMEIALVKPRSGIPFWGSYPNTHARIGLSLMWGWGVSSPFVLRDPASAQAQFQINPSVLTRFPDLDTMTTETNIIFVEEERSRFFRKYYTGLRFKTHFFSDKVEGTCDWDPGVKPCHALFNRFPGIFDLTIGQDETVTGGQLKRWVLRADAVYPVPFARGFHIYGTAYTALAKNDVQQPIILSPANMPLALSDAALRIQAVPARKRDYYRIGLGFDLAQYLRKQSEAGGKQTAAAPAQPDTVASAEQKVKDAEVAEAEKTKALDDAAKKTKAAKENLERLRKPKS